MSSAQRLTSRTRAMLVFSLCIAGIAVGWVAGPHGANALSYLKAVIGPAWFGAMCLFALRRDERDERAKRAAFWVRLLLPALFLIIIAGNRQVPLLTALGLAAAAIVAIPWLRAHQRASIVSAIVSCALLAATLIGGQLLN